MQPELCRRLARSGGDAGNAARKLMMPSSPLTYGSRIYPYRTIMPSAATPRHLQGSQQTQPVKNATVFKYFR